MDLGVPPLETKNLLESNPMKYRFLLCGRAATGTMNIPGQHTVESGNPLQSLYGYFD